MRGYKAFNKDLTCRGYQFEIGKEYKEGGMPKLCENGFHFCLTIGDCYDYYDKGEDTRICVIEALGDIDSKEDENKLCTNRIRIVEEITGYERYGNNGINNVGYSNKGDHNKGDSNKGSYNKGDSNKGSYNKGDYNEGYYNRGNYNEGRYNKGDYNEGCCNIGIRNKCDYSIGLLCTQPQEIWLFNKPSGLTLKDLYESGVIYDIMNGRLSDGVRALPNFDEEIWNEIMEVKE